jgi:hypothetical protein
VFIKKLRNVLLVWLGLLVLLALFSTLTHRQRDYNRVESSVVDGILPVFSVFNALKISVLSVWNHYVYLVHTRRQSAPKTGRPASKRKRQLQEQIQRLGRCFILKRKVGPADRSGRAGAQPLPAGLVYQ